MLFYLHNLLLNIVTLEKIDIVENIKKAYNIVFTKRLTNKATYDIVYYTVLETLFFNQMGYHYIPLHFVTALSPR